MADNKTMSTYSRRGLKRNKSETHASAGKADPPSVNRHNRLLAGYLANEFLTNSTILGQKWDPARVEAAPLESKKPLRDQPMVVNRKCYKEVTSLLKKEETHLPGVFNPSQLVCWLQM